MMLQIKYACAGFLMGIAELIPGISGSTIAVIFNIYKNLMSILTELKWSNASFNLAKLTRVFQLRLFAPLLFSMFLSILLFSKGIDYFLTNYEQRFFLVLGWLMMLLSIQVANFFTAIISKPILLVFFVGGVFLGFLLSNLGVDTANTHPLYLFLSGIVAFAFFLIPGISGSAMLIALGVYGTVIKGISNFDLETLIPFGAGCFTSLVLLPRLIVAIYKAYEDQLLLIFSGLIFCSGYFLI